MAKSKAQKDVERLSRESVSDIKQFEQGLSNILKGYGKLEERQKVINRLISNYRSISKKLTEEQKESLNKQLKLYDQLIKSEEKRKNLIKGINSTIVSGLREAYKFLNTVDASIKDSALNLGLSRTLSDQYRNNLIEASQYAARLGMSVESLTKMQQAYNTEVGTNILLTAKSLKAVTAIAQGTALSAEEAGTLAGQFELFGKNASGVKSLVEDTAVEANNMGLNLNKVLKDISGNFRQIQSYNFANGINGIQKMAMYANMYKLNITSAFAAIDKARTLEGAVEMSAKLMVMGGEFSKQNMFEIGFMARNRPEEFLKKMAEMSKGVYFFNKQTGEFETSAFDLDRLRAVAEATGIDFQTLTESARRVAKIDLAKSQLGALKAEDKELIANMAEMGKDGKLTVTIGNDIVKINTLTASQIETFKLQQASLDQRAKDALTFDKEFSTLIAEFKTLFLPALGFFNTILRNVQGYFTEIGETGRKIMTGVGIAFTIGIPKLLLMPLNGILNGFLARLQAVLTKSNIGGGITGGTGPVGKGRGAMGGLGKAAGGALAVGGAFLAASYGITMIADSFKQLNPEQLNAITKAIVTMGISIPASLYAISIAGAVTAKVAPLIALVFGSIGLAALGMGKGIEFAATGLSKLFSSLTPDIAKSITDIGWGFGKIGIGLWSLGLPLATLGIFNLTGLLASLSLFKGTLGSLSELSTSMANGTDGFREFGNAMTKVGEVINNDKAIKELRQLINDLNNTKISNPINELKEILSKPLKVEFSEKDVSMVINLTTQIDGKQIASSTYSHLVKLGINKANNKG
jgi:hypothetical protein